MLKQIGKWTSNCITLLPHPNSFSHIQPLPSHTPPSSEIPLKIRTERARQFSYHAKRRVIYDENEDDDEDYGYNEELAILESYSQMVNDEILLVQALVDEVEVEVLIYKGFSSCLNYRTSSNPSRSVLPAKAIIKGIDRARGPFDPSNIQYIEKGLNFEEFKTRLTKQI